LGVFLELSTNSSVSTTLETRTTQVVSDGKRIFFIGSILLVSQKTDCYLAAGVGGGAGGGWPLPL
jgi:hypothetical protein